VGRIFEARCSVIDVCIIHNELIFTCIVDIMYVEIYAKSSFTSQVLRMLLTLRNNGGNQALADYAKSPLRVRTQSLAYLPARNRHRIFLKKTRKNISPVRGFEDLLDAV